MLHIFGIIIILICLYFNFNLHESIPVLRHQHVTLAIWWTGTNEFVTNVINSTLKPLRRNKVCPLEWKRQCCCLIMICIGLLPCVLSWVQSLLRQEGANTRAPKQIQWKDAPLFHEDGSAITRRVAHTVVPFFIPTVPLHKGPCVLADREPPSQRTPRLYWAWGYRVLLQRNRTLDVIFSYESFHTFRS